MKFRAVISGVLLVGSILPGTVYSSPLLKANGVSTEQDAKDYYAIIDPANERLTQTAWRIKNGFPSSTNPVPVNNIVVVTGHQNISDLGFWRRIEMVIDKRPNNLGNVAMTTYNFVQGPNDGTVPAVFKCCEVADALSIVNMEYSPGPSGDKITKFYVYDANDGKRKNFTQFSLDPAYAENLNMPNACASCHGGGRDFRVRGGDTGGGWLAFDFNTFSYVDSVAVKDFLDSGLMVTGRITLRVSRGPHRTRGVLPPAA